MSLWNLQTSPSYPGLREDLVALTGDKYQVRPFVYTPFAGCIEGEVHHLGIWRGTSNAIRKVVGKPGVFSINPEYNTCGTWKNRLGKRFLNHGGEAISWRSLARRSKDVHVRPMQDFKQFGGMLVEGSNVENTFHNLVALGHSLKLDDLVWASPLREIAAEYRVAHVGAKHYGRQYSSNGKLVERGLPMEKDVLQRCLDVCIWKPHDVCVADYAESDGEISLMEFNCWNCSGWYGHDLAGMYSHVGNLHTLSIGLQV
jgi:hypothetical protein